MEDKIVSARVEGEKKVYTRPEVRSERLEGTALAHGTCSCSGESEISFVTNGLCIWHPTC